VSERPLVRLASSKSLVLALFGLLLAQLASLPSSVAQAPQPGAPAAGASKAGDGTASTLPPELSAALSKATATLAEIEKGLQNLSEIEGDLAGYRSKAEEVLDITTETADKARPQLSAIKSQIEKLGPAPGKDAPPEPPEIAAERSRLAAQVTAYDGAVKTSEFIWVRARQLIGEIAERRYALFTKNLMERRPSPLTPGAWREVATHASNVQMQFAAWWQHWRRQASGKETQVAGLLGGTALLWALMRLALGRATSRRKKRREPPLPTFFERAVSAFRVAGLRLLPPLVACFVLYFGLDALDLVQGNPWGRLVPTFLRGALIYAAISALAAAVLAPSAPQWRLLPLADRPARRVRWLLAAIAAVYALDGVLTEVSRAFYLPLALNVAQSIAASVIFATLLIGLLLTPFVPQSSDMPQGGAMPERTGDHGWAAASGPYSRHRPRWLKLPLWIAALGIVVAALGGYAALARFAAQQLLVTGIVALLAWLGYLAIRAFTRESTQQSRALGDLMQGRLGLDQPRREQLGRIVEIILTLALVLCALPFLMLQWGFAPADIRDWFTSILFGIEIGHVRISLVRILGGILLFLALLFATRLVQRWMRERAVQSRVEPGIANSIETVVGYAGITLGALLAVSYAGFDVTNLAIVAGALSVGIGFGLQSIVNNFVSGLILLVERPIKVGDRVVVGDQQGYVRRISVRATEVETFDRASVIVPNSELITGRVVNWSHRDWRGAVSVKIGVAYDADPDEVMAILKKCAEDHPKVLPNPPPGVSLEEFGENALVFAVRVSLADIDQGGGVQSDLRLAILKALRAAGVEIPFSQVDVTLRDLETMRGYLDEALERPIKKHAL
jgi:potassium-dependent mechanosensitive channel